MRILAKVVMKMTLMRLLQVNLEKAAKIRKKEAMRNPKLEVIKMKTGAKTKMQKRNDFVLKFACL